MSGDTEKLAETTSPNAPRAVTEKDLGLLVCPVCRAALVLQSVDPLPEIRCVGCGRQYPIADGIPILLAGRASPTDQMPSFKTEGTVQIRNT